VDSRRNSAARGVILTSDAIIVVMSMFAAYGGHALLRPYVPEMRGLPPLREFAAVAYVALPMWLILIAWSGLHRVLERAWSRFELITRLIRMHAVGTILLALAVFVTQATLNRTVVAVFVACSFGLLLAERWLLVSYARAQHASGRATKRLLVIGDPGPALDRFVARRASLDVPPLLLGRLGAPSTGGADEAAPHLGAVATLPEHLGREAVDEVVFFPPYDEPRRMVEAIEACTTVGVPASFVLDTEPLGGLAPQVSRENQTTLLTFEIARRSPVQLAVKHAFDALAAAVLLVLVAPILVAAGVAILVTMGRPVVFVQQRAGLRGRSFSMLKLRTMVRDAASQQTALASRNEMSGPVFKVTDDPRVTRLGSFLRKTSIDELPQLLNVLTGAMSLVGPRPLPVGEQERIHGWHRRRLSVKPGITCLWQIGGRNQIDFDDWMNLDLRYVDEWSLTLDLKILLLTIPAVLGRRGAR
jgi:exopolysaccharide biosynthesis polyprenyl glycosylphosphotransferase